MKLLFPSQYHHSLLLIFFQLRNCKKWFKWIQNRITIGQIYRIMMYLLEIEIIYLVNLIVTFWNCCFALFKSSLRCPEQSRYLRAYKIHGAKRGSHDRRFTDFRAAICSCRPIEIIAVHAVNSGPNNPDYSRSSSLFLYFSLFLFLSPFCHFSTLLFFFETRRTRVAISRPRKDP